MGDVNVTGYPLEWNAVINTDSFDVSIEKINQKLTAVSNESVKQAKIQQDQVKQLVASFAGVDGASQKAMVSFQQVSRAQEGAIETQKRSIQQLGQAFDQSEQDLKDYMATLDQMNKEGVNFKVNQRAPDSPKTVADQHISIDSDSLKTLNNAKQVFRDMDAETQLFIKELVELEMQLGDVKKAQKALDEQMSKGEITTKQFTQATQSLTAQEKNIGQSISLITQRQKEFEKSLDPVVQKTISAQQRLSQLKKDMASNPTSPAFIEWQKEATDLQLSINRVNQELKNAVALQTLQNRQASINSALVGEKDVTKIKAYKQELSTIGTQIAKVSGTGVTGFSAVGTEIAKTATKTNLLSKGFSFIRQAAYLIPGIGMAGIFNVIGEAVVALVTNLFQGGKAFDEFKEKAKAYMDIQTESIKGFVKESTHLEFLRKIILDTKRTMSERNAALKEYNETAAESNKIDVKSIGNIGLVNQKISEQIALIKQRALSRAAENVVTSRAEALLLAEEKAKAKAMEDQNAEIKNRLTLVANQPNGKKTPQFVIDFERDADIRRRVREDKDVKEAQKSLDLATDTANKMVTIDTTVTKTKEKNKAKTTGETKSENELNKLLSKRFQILQDIQALQRDATQSGLDEEASALDKINEKYDRAKEKAIEFNKLAEAHNKTSTKQVTLIDTSTIDTARIEETTNQRLKDDAKRFTENLDQQKQIFEQYEEAKKSIGIAKANEMFKGQTKGFKDYQDFLKDEVKKNLPAIQQTLMGFGSLLNVGDRQKVKSLFATLSENGKNMTDKQIKDLGDLLAKTANYYDQKELLDYQYQQLFQTLSDERGKITEEEYDRRLKALQQSQAEEEESLKAAAVRQSEIYKMMGQDLLLKSKEGLQEIIDKIDETLKQGFVIDKKGDQVFITPQMRKDLESGRSQISGMVDETQKVADIFKNLSGFARNFDEQLGNVLDTMSSMVSASKTIKDSIKAFNVAVGDKKNKKDDDLLGQLGAIAGIAGAVGGVVGAIAGIFAKQAAERKKHLQEIQDFNTTVYTGEFKINQLYRERTLEQIKLNKLRLEGITDENRLLKEQKSAIEQDANTVLKELQQQTAQVLGKQILPTINGKDANDKIFQNLIDAGKSLDEIRQMFENLPDAIVDVKLTGLSFDQLEQLFIKGQLQGKAKELFEQLQKLKEEGVNVDKQLEDLKKQAQEVFTGTTSDAILDSIVSGFSKGLNSAADFASDFEGFMKQAMLNSFKFKYLEGPLKKFYEDFAAASESNGSLTSDEIQQLNDQFNAIINAANSQFQQLQLISGLNLGVDANSTNSLAGAIKAQLTEETGTILAGKFNAFQMTALDQLNIAKQALVVHQRIEANTAATVQELKNQTNTLTNILTIQGIKLKP